jgi:hypothetical protein
MMKQFGQDRSLQQVIGTNGKAPPTLVLMQWLTLFQRRIGLLDPPKVILRL